MGTRLLIVTGALAGAGGVIAAALAAHAGGGNLDTVSLFLMVHAPALLTLGLSGRFVSAGHILAAGLVVFTGDLLMRDLAGVRLFPYAAPLGGTLLIGGWLIVAACALLRRD